MNGWITAVRILTRFTPAVKDEEEAPALISGWFTVIGGIIGLLLWLTAVVCLFLLHRILGTLVAAILIPVLYWWLTGGRYFKNLRNLLHQWTARWQHDAETIIYVRILAIQTIFLVKAVGIGLLVYHGHALWILLLPMFSATVMAHYAMTETGSQTRATRWAYAHWMVAAIITATVSGIKEAFAAGALTFVIVALMTPVLRQFLIQATGKLTESSQRAAAGFTDIVVLLIGLIYFFAA